MDEDHLRRVLALQEKIGITFNDPLLGLEALTHGFYTPHHRHPTKCYERLELLGDAILDALVVESLFRADRGADEGKPTQRRDAIVCGKNLERLAESLRIAQLGLFSPFNGRPFSRKTLRRCGAKMVEAIIGALFLDDGMDKARIFVDRFLMPRPSPLPSVTWEDADRRLNEFAMRKRSIIPTYRIQTVEENRRHRCCFIGDTLISQAEGGDAHEAKALAAKDALETERRWSGQVSRAAARSGS